MNQVAADLVASDLGVRIADDPASLTVLKNPDCPGVVWRRQVPSDVKSWIAGLNPDKLPKGRIILRPNAVQGAVQHLCDIAGTPHGSARDWLEADIHHLADIFSDLMSVGYIRLRLDVVTTNACRKFHLDALTARLICTYRGDGTQYGLSADGTDPSRVFQVATGAPILLRGSLWPEEPPSGLLHRSPPIEGTGKTRLVLVLDPIFDPEEES